MVQKPGFLTTCCLWDPMKNWMFSNINWLARFPPSTVSYHQLLKNIALADVAAYVPTSRCLVNLIIWGATPQRSKIFFTWEPRTAQCSAVQPSWRGPRNWKRRLGCGPKQGPKVGAKLTPLRLGIRHGFITLTFKWYFMIFLLEVALKKRAKSIKHIQTQKLHDFWKFSYPTDQLEFKENLVEVSVQHGNYSYKIWRMEAENVLVDKFGSSHFSCWY